MRLLGLVALWFAAATATAHAAPPSIAIRGDACDLSGLEAELAELLASRTIGDARVSVVTSASSGALNAEVLFEDADGKTHGLRVVTASSCDDLVDSIALVIVMAMPEATAAKRGNCKRRNPR